MSCTYHTATLTWRHLPQYISEYSNCRMCHGTAKTRRQFLAPMARGNVIRPRKLAVVMSLCAVTICLMVIASLQMGQGQHAFFVSPGAPPRRESTRGKRLTGGPVTIHGATRHPRLFVGVVERQLENRATGVVVRNSTTVVNTSQQHLSVDRRNNSVTGENTLVKDRGQIVDGGDFSNQTHTGDQQGMSPTNSPGRLSVKRWQISTSRQKLFYTSAPVRTFLYPDEVRERSNLLERENTSLEVQTRLDSVSEGGRGYRTGRQLLSETTTVGFAVKTTRDSDEHIHEILDLHKREHSQKQLVDKHVEVLGIDDDDDDDESNNNDHRETDDDLDVNYDGQHVNGNQHHGNVIHLTDDGQHVNGNQHHGNVIHLTVNEKEHHGKGKDHGVDVKDDGHYAGNNGPHKEDDEHNGNEDKEPHKENEKHNGKEDKEALKKDDKHNGKEDKEAHKNDDKHNGKEDKKIHKKDDKHNGNEDKEPHKEDDEHNENDDKEPHKEVEKHNGKEDKEAHENDDKHNGKEDKEAHKKDDKHNGKEDKEAHKKDDKHNGNETKNPHKHDDKNSVNEYTLRTHDDEHHTNEDRQPPYDDKRAESENRRKNVTYETLWEDYGRPMKGPDYYGQEHESPSGSNSEHARMDDAYLLEDGGQPIPNYDHGDYMFEDALASKQQYSYVFLRHDPKSPNNITEEIRSLFPPIRHQRFRQPAFSWKKYQSANAMGSEKGLSVHRWLDRLLNVSYWRSASAGHSADFAGDLPLFPRCRSDLAPGPYGYIKRPNYLKNSKNPCWTVGARPTLACIPDFYLVGISKSGTTHLYHRLAEHTDIVHGSVKEPQFFSRTRFLENGAAFRRYTRTYRTLAYDVQRDLEEKGFSKKITGDGSPNYFFNNKYWRLFSGNEGCTEPRVLIAHHILHLHPKAKVIIIYRDPVERLYSRYLYFCGNHRPCTEMGYLSPQSFHHAVENGLSRYLDCLLRWSLRHCVYNTTLAASVNAALRIQESLYPVLLEDWLRIVSRQQMHVIQFERYVANETLEIERVYSFLGLKPQPNPTKTKKRWRNPGRFYNAGPMLPQTRTLLQTFFQPFMRRFELMLRHNGLLRSSHSDLDGRGRIAE